MSFLNLYICPGCNAELTPDNTGCPYCEYGVDHGLLADDAEFWPEHVPPLSWWLHTNKLEDNEEMRDVCMGYIRRLLAEIQRAELRIAGRTLCNTEVGLTNQEERWITY